MTVLHLIPSLSGGGTERQLSLLVKQQATAGWQVHVSALMAGPGSIEGFSESATIHWLRYPGSDAALTVEILRLISVLRPSIVHTWLRKMDVLGGFVTRVLRVPWVMSERSSELAYPPTLGNRVRRLIGRHADAIIANSEAGAKLWQVKGRSGVRVIKNGLDVAAIDGAPPLSDLVPASLFPFVLYAGRLDAEKNIIGTCAALNAVVANTGAAVVVCGDGVARDYVVEQLAQPTRDGRAYVTGFNAHIWSYMKLASAFVSVSRFEGNPNAVLEAMVAGCPVVLSDIPAHREIATDDSCWFVAVERPEAVAKAVAEILADPDLAESRAHTARRIVAAMTIERTAREHMEVYGALTARN